MSRLSIRTRPAPQWTPKTVRMRLAEFDVGIVEFARLAGIHRTHMSRLLHREDEFSARINLLLDRALSQLAEEHEERERLVEVA